MNWLPFLIPLGVGFLIAISICPFIYQFGRYKGFREGGYIMLKLLRDRDVLSSEFDPFIQDAKDAAGI